MIKKGILLLGFILPFHLFAQNKPHHNNYYVAAATQFGKIIPNNSQLNYLWDVSMYGLEIQFGKNTTGKKEWEQRFRYPDYGVAMRYLNFDYDSFGSALALYGFLNGRFFRYKLFSLRYSLGAGLIYWPKHYHKQNNPENFFIGSPVNAHIDLTFSGDFAISKAADLFVKAAFSHSSNGAIVLPNRGINTVSAHVGLRYHLKKERPQIYTLDTVNSFYPKNIVYFFIAPGLRMSKTDGLYYYKQGIQIGYSRHFHPKFRYGGGIDINYSGDLKSVLPQEEQKIGNYWTQSLFASFDIKYGRFMLHLALGVYTFKSTLSYTAIYERVGFRFLLGAQENHFVGVAIKAHGGSADFIEWTYGFNFYHWEDKKAKELKLKKRERI